MVRPAVVPYGVDRFTGIRCLMSHMRGAPGELLFTHRGEPVTWEPNDPFAGQMRISGGSGGFELTDTTTEVSYVLFPTDLLTLIERDVIRGGVVNELWEVVKRNTAYGLSLI